MVGPLAFAGENDGMAAESEFAGWAAEIFSGNHAIEKTRDMSDLAYATIDDETTDAWPFDDHGSCVCWFLHEGHCCSRSRVWSVAPLWDVFSIFSSVRAIQMLAAFAFSFLFSVSLGRDACCDADGIILPSAYGRVRVFKLPLFLDPGFFEHVAHVWKGKLTKDESEENVSLLSSGTKSFSGSFVWDPGWFSPRAWRARVLEGETELHLVLAGPSRRNWKLSSLVKTSSSSSKGQRCSDSGGQGRRLCCIGPGCWGHGYGCIRHGWREDREPLVIFGKSGYHAELHCALLLTDSWWVS